MVSLAPKSSDPVAQPRVMPGGHHKSHEDGGLDPLVGLATPLLLVKPADETVNNSSTLQDDNDLHFYMEAGEYWEIEIGLLLDSGVTPDFKFDVTVPAGATINYAVVGRVAGAISLVLGGAGGTMIDGLGAPYFQVVHYYIRNSTTAGQFVLQWAQNTLTASDTKVLAGSYLKAWRMKPVGGVQKVGP